MAEHPTLDNATEPVPVAETAELQQREQWFTASPDPWAQIVHLEHGGDRTFASTIQQMALNAEASQRPAIEDKLLHVLNQQDLTDAGRQFVCRMLGWIGSARSVPALTGWLQRNDTADVARLALDVNDDPGVAQVYREALGHLTGRARLGLIGSIARRGDTAAVEVLTAIGADASEPADVRAGAERAVERLSALNLR